MDEIEACPWCGSKITRTKFVEIEAKIRSQALREAAEHEARIKNALEEDFKLRLASETRKLTQAAKEGAEKVLEAAKAEEAKLKCQLDEQRKAAEATANEIENIVKSKLDEQRTILDLNLQSELAKRDAEHKREMEKTQTQLKDMSRRLEKKTASELGETPEIDLFDKLRETFDDDRIVRVKRGVAGADIHQSVIHRDQNRGLIIHDSKNHMAWRNDFVNKLRADQIDAKADHAILATTVFPSGQKELCIVDGVIVVTPARAIFIVQILRAAMISLHKQGLSQQQRQTKVEQL